MKTKFQRIAAVLLVALTIGIICTSCDPDLVDAFADGYRDGYYGNY